VRDTIELARESGFDVMRVHGVLPHVPKAVFIANVCVTEEVNRLVELARADEREACAKVCDSWSLRDSLAAEMAEEIRARGETK
jgi:hypothetical protein